MSSTKHKLRLAGGLAFLATLALTISCTGFFVNPTVSAITIDPPNPTVSQGLTTQLTAAGTDSNGNAITLTGGTSCSGTTVCWSTDTPTIATITTGGLLTGISAGTSTITASSGTASATATATVTLGNVTSIVVGPVTSFNLPENSVATGNDCLTAKATAGGTTVDVTASVTWVAGDSTIITVQNGVTPMCVQSLANSGPTTIVAQYISGTNTVTSNVVNVTVSP
jgi:trimeric autotransporter adhesin